MDMDGWMDGGTVRRPHTASTDRRLEGRVVPWTRQKHFSYYILVVGYYILVITDDILDISCYILSHP